jgi:hypothetical protein
MHAPLPTFDPVSSLIKRLAGFIGGSTSAASMRSS